MQNFGCIRNRFVRCPIQDQFAKTKGLTEKEIFIKIIRSSYEIFIRLFYLLPILDVYLAFAIKVRVYRFSNQKLIIFIKFCKDC